MSSFFDDLYAKDNPNATKQPVANNTQTVPTQAAPKVNFLENQYTQDNPNTAPTPPIQNPSLTQSFVKGATRTGASLPIYSSGMGPPELEQGVWDAEKKRQELVNTPGQLDKTLNQQFPNASNSTTGAAVEGLGSAAADPLSYAAGPIGIVGSAISGATTGALNHLSPDHPIVNSILGIGAGIAGQSGIPAIAKAGRIGLENAGWLEKPSLVKAWEDQGITGRTAAGVGENSMPKTVRTFRESPVSNRIDDAEKLGGQQLEAAINRQADTLGSNADTLQEAGTAAQSSINDYVQKSKSLLSAAHNVLDAHIDPKTTNIDAYPVLSKLIDNIGATPGAEAQTSKLLPKAQSYLEALMADIVTRNKIPGNNDALPLAAIKDVKRNVGDLLEQSILNGDTSKRQLNIIYGTLADAEKSAYIGTPMESLADNARAFGANFYSNMDKHIEPFIREGMTPERLAQQLKTGARLGDTKLSALFNEVPEARAPIASETIRNLGSKTNGEFDPNVFFKNWEKVSPEAKITLFGDAATPITGELPAAYDQLALLAQRQGESQLARNMSGTAGASEGFNLLRSYAKAVGSVGGMLAGGIGGHAVGMGIDGIPKGMGEMGGAMAGLSLGSHVAEPLLVHGAGKAIPALMTNPTFVRWLATPQTIEGLPLSLKALASAAGQSPEIMSFINYANGKSQNNLQPGEKGRGFLGGGYAALPDESIGGFADGGKVGPFVSANSNNPPDRITGSFRSGWDQLGVSTPFDNSSILDSIIAPQLIPKPPANDYALGGITNTPNMEYAEGGPVDRFGQAVQSLTKLGVDPEVAKGAVKYMYINESGLNPDIINPTSGAYGISQVLGSRKKDLFAQYSNKPSYENELDHINHELTTGKDGGNTLKLLLAATGKGEKAGYDIWGSAFERPGLTDLAKAMRNYKPGEVSVTALTSKNNSNSKDNSKDNDQSVLDQFLAQGTTPDNEPQDTTDEITKENMPVIKAINDASWIEAPTKYAATKILSEHT